VSTTANGKPYNADEVVRGRYVMVSSVASEPATIR
jgi:hypothetical protein